MELKGHNLGAINMMDYKLEYKIKSQFMIDMIATIIFAFDAILVSVGYVGELVKDSTF